jgi:hypothetical protein
MRRFLIRLTFVALMFGAALPATAAPQPAPTTQAAPELVVLSPRNGDVITGSEVTVQIQLENFTIIKSPVPYEADNPNPAVNKDGEGHLHLELDLLPLVVWDDGSLIYTFRNIAPGEHELEVEISNNDHTYPDPEIVRTIRFRTVAAPANSPAATAAPAATTAATAAPAATTAATAAPGATTASAPGATSAPAGGATDQSPSRLPVTASGSEPVSLLSLMLVIVFGVFVVGFVARSCGQLVTVTEDICLRLRGVYTEASESARKRTAHKETPGDGNNAP